MFSQLEELAAKIHKAWIVLGDFNCLANLNERHGQPVCMNEILPLRSCMQTCGLDNMKYSGRFFTWNNKRNEEKRALSKIDSVMQWLLVG